MSAPDQLYESLPYIDPAISPAERDDANALIQKELPRKHAQTVHPSLPSLPEPVFSALVQKEIDRIASGKSGQGGIDLSRYEAPEEPSADSDVDTWKTALRKAYASSTYLVGRQTNLSLLEELGKNAWLMGNSEFEAILKGLEKELSEIKAQLDNTNRARKAAQEDSRGELLGLEETWKRGISKMIEVQVAADSLQRELLERRRETAT